MDKTVERIKAVINQRGIKLTKVSNETNISYGRLNRIFNCGAALLASEFISLCSFLEIAPESFAENATDQKSA